MYPLCWSLTRFLRNKTKKLLIDFSKKTLPDQKIKRESISRLRKKEMFGTPQGQKKRQLTKIPFHQRHSRFWEFRLPVNFRTFIVIRLSAL